MLRRGLCPRLSFAPFPRRIPRARLSPRAKEQAMPALRRPLPAFPSPVKCRRCPPRPPVFRPLRDGRFFARLFPGRAVFCSFSLRCACIHLCRGACEGGKRDRCAAAQTYSPFCAPFSRFKRTSSFFNGENHFVFLPFFRCAQKTAFSEQSPLSENGAPARRVSCAPRHNRTFLEGQRQSALRRTFVRRRALKNSDEASADSCGRPRRKILRAPHAAAPASFFINT